MASILIASDDPVVIGDGIRIPRHIRSLADFRAWTRSDDFPQTGRIDYISGCIEVDMSPEDFFTHGTLKVEISTFLNLRSKRLRLGYVVSDSTRVTNMPADLSAEPDVVFVSRESLQAGRVRLERKSSEEDDRYVEVTGAPDLGVEVVSDSSIDKDFHRLPPAYFDAGVREYWLVDARHRELRFQIHHRGESRFEPVPVDANGFQPSEVMGCAYRLDRGRDEMGHWQFDLAEQE